MSKNIITPCVILSLVLFVSACSAPGHKMSIPSDLPGVQFRAINSDLIRHQAASRQRVPAGLAAMAFDGYHDTDSYEYDIGPGDILSITVWDHPELTNPAGEYRTAEEVGHKVAQDGTIFYPYAGVLHVEGKTMSEVRDALTSKLARVIQNPQVDVRVAAYRSQWRYVLGEVEEPGRQAITDIPATVMDAISEAGSVTESADLRNATLTRDDKRYPIDLWAMYENGDMTQNVLLKDGDSLHIPDRSDNKVFVTGEVALPTSLVMDDGRMTLSEAISDAGGVAAATGDPAKLYVIRGTHEKPEIFHLNAKSPAQLVLADKFELEPHDVVYVESKQVTRWSRVLGQLIPGGGGILRAPAAATGVGAP
jgi:polysaccharide biosynthesis/export protein